MNAYGINHLRCSQKTKTNRKHILNIYVMFIKYFYGIFLLVINWNFFYGAEEEASNVFPFSPRHSSVNAKNQELELCDIEKHM